MPGVSLEPEAWRPVGSCAPSPSLRYQVLSHFIISVLYQPKLRSHIQRRAGGVQLDICEFFPFRTVINIYLRDFHAEHAFNCLPDIRLVSIVIDDEYQLVFRFHHPYGLFSGYRVLDEIVRVHHFSTFFLAPATWTAVSMMAFRVAFAVFFKALIAADGFFGLS